MTKEQREVKLVAAWGRVEVSLEKYENESSPYLQSIFWDDYLRRLADYNNV